MKYYMRKFDDMKEFEIFLNKCKQERVKLLTKSSMNNLYEFIKSNCYFNDINVRMAEYEVPSNGNKSIIIRQIVDVYVDDDKEGLYYC